MEKVLPYTAVMTGDSGDSNTYIILAALCIVAIIIVVVLGVFAKKK